MQEKEGREREAMMLFRKARSSLMEDMASRQDLKVVKQGVCRDWGRVFQAKGAASAKALGEQQAWCFGDTARREASSLSGRKEWWK